MLIVTAQNVTDGGTLADKDGKAKYDVWVGINHHCIWHGPITGHVRAQGAQALLRRIADAMGNDGVASTALAERHDERA